ncbi:MAG: PVC-type heme-binding CxxCH protein [Planctomycetaceae bacterium]
MGAGAVRWRASLRDWGGVLCCMLLWAGMIPPGAVTFAQDRLEFPRFAPNSPTEARDTFETRPGFEIELVASEPLISSPVAIEYDEWGRGWVLEMHDYPFTNPATDKPFTDKSADAPLGRIRVLTDRDGDGRFDEAQTFVEGISWPTGLAFWRGGVFVAATPDLWYFQDTTGDGVADVRERLYTGFRKFNIQAVMNNLRWGLDHQIHGAGGSNGGTIQAVAEPLTPPVAMGVQDFALDPRTRQFRLQAGGARFGHALDDWGNRFLCNIRNPVIHVVLPAEELARNPFVAPRSSLFDCAETGDTLPVFRSSPPEPWRAFRATRWTTDPEGKLYPRSELVPGGYFTSASGVTVFRGDAWNSSAGGVADEVGQVFVADVAGNLVHRQQLTPAGVTFTAERIDVETEFVRSTDTWFRPVNFTNAPDGTLHIVDMYRETIEHPWSIPDDIKDALDLRRGNDRGRIWRVLRTGTSPRPPAQPLARLGTVELVALLEHLNGWHRDTAARLIFERQDQTVIEPLRKLAESSPQPRSRLLALWGLQGLGALAPADLLKASRDPDGHLREHAVRLAEPWLSRDAPLRERVLALAEDGEPRVRMQVAFTLGSSAEPAAVGALASIARHDVADEFVRPAILSSVRDRAGKLLEALLGDRDWAASQLARPWLRQLARSVGARGDEAELRQIQTLLMQETLTSANRGWKMELVQGLGEGLQRTRRTLAATLPDTTPLVTALLADARELAASTDAAAGARDQAIQLLTLGTWESAREPLLAALAPATPGGVQFSAVRALAAFSEPEIPELLLARWSGATPALRGEIIEALLARAERSPRLLTALEQKVVSAAQRPPSRRGQLMRHADPAICDRARALFASDTASPRGDVIANYQQALQGTPSPDRGAKVFERECANCHRVGGKGATVGPNLETIRHHTPQQVLANILDPNREVTPAYLEYSVLLQEGRVANGLIATETPTSLTLKRPNDVQETILREAIAELNSTGVSLMPEGLEKKITPEEMRDLLGWLLSPSPIVRRK